MDLPDRDGRTALDLAACNGHTESLRELLSRGATVDGRTFEDSTTLQRVAGAGQQIILDCLIKAGANVNAEASEHGRTALQAAAAHGHEGVVQRLLTTGADVNVSGAMQGGSTALEFARNSQHLTVVELLCQPGERD